MNEEILVVSGTNRADSKSLKIAHFYKDTLVNQGANVELYSLEDLPNELLNSDMYVNKPSDFTELIDKLINRKGKFVFIMPEYNGGYPGALKLFIDAVPPAYFSDKKAALVGVSSGLAGGARGMDDFTNVLNYLKVHVHYLKPKLSSIEQAFDVNGNLIGERAIHSILSQAKAFIAY